MMHILINKVMFMYLLKSKYGVMGERICNFCAVGGLLMISLIKAQTVLTDLISTTDITS